MKSIVALAGALLLAIPVFAAAPVALNLKAGLWEHTFRMGSESGRLEAAMEEMQRQLEQMPPDQRQMMEQMMQGHMARPGGGTVNICLTQEEISRGAFPQQEGCQQEIVEQSRDRIRVRFVCDGDPPSSGEGEVTFHDPERYTGKATLSAEFDGEPDIMTIEQSGKWLSDDCGDVEPVH